MERGCCSSLSKFIFSPQVIGISATILFCVVQLIYSVPVQVQLMNKMYALEKVTDFPQNHYSTLTDAKFRERYLRTKRTSSDYYLHLAVFSIQEAGMADAIGGLPDGAMKDNPQYTEIRKSFIFAHGVSALANLLTICCALLPAYQIATRLA